ncbi:hypothetical protein GGS21DRAFT_513151 [Xylaria nigripes]|nr:hypothetical protein GGS21DRAFT_513151 [Xylaria nigripes]
MVPRYWGNIIFLLRTRAAVFGIPTPDQRAQEAFLLLKIFIFSTYSHKVLRTSLPMANTDSRNGPNRYYPDRKMMGTALPTK